MSMHDFLAACPDEATPYIRSIQTLDDLEPGDVILGRREDNGRRGALRVRAAVIVGRYLTDDGPIEDLT